MKARLITLEGGEGAGKSTAVATVRDWLKAQGRTFTETREPGGTPPAERIRALLLDPETGDLEPLTELLLMFAARAENLRQVIRPALARGEDVICDRFTDASMAYQGYGRQLGPAPVETLAGLVHPDLEPALTLLLDVPVSVGMARVGRRSDQRDRFEQNTVAFLERVRQGYLEQARKHPERYLVIDASQPLEQVTQAIRQGLAERLS
ncbi:dTMP kinase [Wenzhouxiangella marina]|uniref:Thymidylate kinase n=1 Tax=Wenzhouxiangella marina TaxID=1579979 RepID=A0A0K0XWE0_9GAMM|nr:dTMP kinase [Wenzhouxiangella marina]AKS41947.1 thymidylate kinase [Wenzhouxiangella marina]MBB6086286.1 dTMP kinase [Wenzhouxiangella marina]